MATHFWKIPKGAIRIPLPDTSQDTDFSCGACSLLSICIYYGVGPVEERIVVRDSGMSDRGANPEHLLRAAKQYGLSTEEVQPMTVSRLLEMVERGRPVVCMLQAWGDRKQYRDVWDNGHWVVAIGWDKEGIYFEDPSIDEARGYLTYAEMEDRWHDVGKYNKHMPQYGLVVWHAKEAPKGRQVEWARRIL